MAAKILVATPHVAFSELIRQSLIESGGYSVDVTSRGIGLVDRCRTGGYRILIMDSDLPDVSVVDMGRALINQLPDMRLALFPPGNDPKSLLLADFKPHAFLRKPFYLPDLLETVESLLPAPGEQPISKPPLRPQPTHTAAGMDWMEDATRAAQHLTRLSRQSTAQVALITRGGKLWAHAGQLSEDAAQELAELITRYWDINGGCDLARFARLNTTGAQYMLYATSVTGDLVLALAFDASTPFSQIRLQTADLAHALTSPPPYPPVAAAPPQRIKWEPELDEEPYEVEPIDISALPPLFDDVPPPNPARLPVGWVYETLAVPSEPVQASASPASAEDQPAAASSSESAPVGVTEVSTAEFSHPAEQQEIEGTVSAQEKDTLPVLESATPELNDLEYACVLLPNFPQHYLTGELAAKLAAWMPDICAGFGWRLEGLSIRPDYIQWVIRVLPGTAQGTMLKTIRQALSQRLFETYPHLEYENLSGDFWAPGQLVVSGTQMAPGQMVRNFIAQTRQRQGAR